MTKHDLPPTDVTLLTGLLLAGEVQQARIAELEAALDGLLAYFNFDNRTSPEPRAELELGGALHWWKITPNGKASIGRAAYHAYNVLAKGREE